MTEAQPAAERSVGGRRGRAEDLWLRDSGNGGTGSLRAARSDAVMGRGAAALSQSAWLGAAAGRSNAATQFPSARRSPLAARHDVDECPTTACRYCRSGDILTLERSQQGVGPHDGRRLLVKAMPAQSLAVYAKPSHPAARGGFEIAAKHFAGRASDFPHAMLRADNREIGRLHALVSFAVRHCRIVGDRRALTTRRALAVPHPWWRRVQ